MVRKRIIRWLAGVILLALVVCTVVSNSVYQASLPRVRTRVVEQEVGDLLDGYGIWETFAWIPRECVFPGNSEDTVYLYRIWQRTGQFTSTEYYAEAQEVPVLDEREDAGPGGGPVFELLRNSGLRDQPAPFQRPDRHLAQPGGVGWLYDYNSDFR